MNPFKLPARTLLLILFAVCSSLLGFGLYLQHGLGLEPCPMCIMQRYAFMTVAVLALIAGLHGPGRTGQRVYLGLITLFAVVGGSIAARQSWMQLNPPEIPECGPDLAFMLDAFPLAQALPMIFSGSGDCASIEWSFLGLSIANWSLVSFTGTVIFALWLFFRRQPGR
ncbi:MAG: disulfide bond formation protein B [Rhodocyclaceae bacterium]|jgi:disulfide bond formation protein DsbB|nr:disulfide bond formation protein B [Rhodocyclaceae bacterium]